MIARESELVRLRVSSVIMYFAHIYKLIIAIVFTLIVIRKLSVHDYGAFTIIVNIIGALTTGYYLWSVWIVRFYAWRQFNRIRPLNTWILIYGISSVFIFIICIWSIYENMIEVTYPIIALSIANIMTTAVMMYHRSIAVTLNPSIRGVSIIIGETVRILTVFITLYLSQLSIESVMLAVVMSIIAMDFTLLLVVPKEHRLPKLVFNNKLLIEVLKLTYVSVIAVVTSIIFRSITPILAYVLSSSVIAAYLGVMLIPYNVIYMGGTQLAVPLYIQLLRLSDSSSIDRKRFIEDTLRVNAFIGTLFTSILIANSLAILTMFKPVYRSLNVALKLTSIAAFISSYTAIFESSLIGIERMDMEYIGVKLTRSYLFKVNSLRLLRTLTMLLSALVLGNMMKFSSFIELCTYISISWIILELVFLIIVMSMCIRRGILSVPLKDISLCIVGAVVSSISIANISEEIPVDVPLIMQLQYIAPLIAVQIIIYTIITIGFSSSIRSMVVTTLNIAFKMLKLILVKIIK